DFYIKAGDYDEKSLTSADVLKEWGGETRFMPLVLGRSTTSVIEKIIRLYVDRTVDIHQPQGPEKKRAVFLDRDGVINEELEYVSELKDFKFLPHVFEGVKKLEELGYAIVIVTTQAGIGLGYFTKEDFYRVNKHMLGEFHKHG